MTARPSMQRGYRAPDEATMPGDGGGGRHRLAIVAWAAAATFFVLAVAVVTRGVLQTITGDLSAIAGALRDFRDAGYYPVAAVLDGVVPYDVDRYFAEYPVGQEFPLLPPMYLVVHAPFQLLGLVAASTTMFAINLLGLIALCAWSLHLARYRVTPLAVIVVGGLAIASNGGRNVLNTGQATLLMVAGAYLALTARREAAGAVGVFTALVKPAIGGPITLLLAAAGRVRRSVVGVVAAVGVSVVLMLPMVAWAGGPGDLIDILRDNAAYSAGSLWISLETTTARIDVAATVAMLFDVVPSGAVEALLGLAVIAMAGAVLFLRRSVLWHGSHGDAVVVLISVATLIAVYHSFYDLVLLILPILLVARPDFAGGTTPTAMRYGLLAALLFAAFNPFRFGPVVGVVSDSTDVVQVLSPGLTGLGLLVAFALSLAAAARLPAAVAEASS